MKLTISSIFIFGLLAAAACGPSSARINQAKTSAYRADYAIVWNASIEAVRKSYSRIKVEDAQNGVIVTDWHKIERVADSQSTDPALNGGLDTSGALFFRMSVKIVGKEAPFQVVVDGEAARYRPGYSSLFPFKHTDSDEPEWVNGRIDGMYVAIFERLEQYAVPASEVQRSAPQEDMTPAASGPPPEDPAGTPADPAAPPPADPATPPPPPSPY